MDPFITRTSVCSAGNKSRHRQGSFHMLTLTILQRSYRAFSQRLGLALCASSFQQLSARPDLISSVVLGNWSLIFAPLYSLGRDSLLHAHTWFSADPYRGARLTWAARNIDQHAQPRQGEVSSCQDSSAFTEHALMSTLLLAYYYTGRAVSGSQPVTAVSCLGICYLLAPWGPGFGSPGENLIIIICN